MKKMEDSYNQAQRHWVDNMINACRDYQRHEEERSDFLQGHFLKYIETCVGVDEASAEVRCTCIWYYKYHAHTHTHTHKL